MLRRGAFRKAGSAHAPGAHGGHCRQPHNRRLARIRAKGMCVCPLPSLFACLLVCVCVCVCVLVCACFGVCLLVCACFVLFVWNGFLVVVGFGGVIVWLCLFPLHLLTPVRPPSLLSLLSTSPRPPRPPALAKLMAIANRRKGSPIFQQFAKEAATWRVKLEDLDAASFSSTNHTAGESSNSGSYGSGGGGGGKTPAGAAAAAAAASSSSSSTSSSTLIAVRLAISPWMIVVEEEETEMIVHSFPTSQVMGWLHVKQG